MGVAAAAAVATAATKEEAAEAKAMAKARDNAKAKVRAKAKAAGATPAAETTPPAKMEVSPPPRLALRWQALTPLTTLPSPSSSPRRSASVRLRQEGHRQRTTRRR